MARSNWRGLYTFDASGKSGWHVPKKLFQNLKEVDSIPPSFSARRRTDVSVATKKAMDRDRTPVAQAHGVPPGRPAGRLEPGLSDRDYFRSQERLALEHASRGNGLRQRRHLLATTSAMDPSGSLARVAPPTAASIGETRFATTFASGRRQRVSACGFGGRHTGPNPTDRAKRGCKRHIITDARGVPLAVETGPANEPDAQLALALLDKIPAVAGRRGRPRRKPKVLQGDAAYGIGWLIQQVVGRGIRPLLSPYGRSQRQHGSGLGKTRYVVERTLSWFGNYRRLKQCYERHGEHFQAFHELAASLICAKKLSRQKRVLK